MLATKCLFEHGHGMAAVNADGIAGNIGGRKKRKAHDVVPMHMGHKKIVDLRLGRTLFSYDLLA